MNERRDYSQTVFPAVVVVDDCAHFPRGTRGWTYHEHGDVWRFYPTNRDSSYMNHATSREVFRLQIDVTVPARPRRHAAACTEANDRSATEVCRCEPKGETA